MRTLYTARAVLTPDRPDATALLVDGDRVAWIGTAEQAAQAGRPDAVVRLSGAVITPAFVDAHVHLTETGLLLGSLDLHRHRSVGEILDAVAAAARGGLAGPLLGHGWDETRLAERRPPTSAELDRAAGGAEVYLARVDSHSAVVSTALAHRAAVRTAAGAAPSGDGVRGGAVDGAVDGGWLRAGAHQAVRVLIRSALTPAARRTAQLAALGEAAAAGLGCLHEMSTPDLTEEEDLRELLALVREPERALPEVIGYRATLVEDAAAAAELVARFGEGLAGLGGDLCVDGSFGSRTAALDADYADAPGQRGRLELTVDQVRDHVAACTRAGVTAGFHAIGEAAVEVVRQGVRRAAERAGIAAVRRAGHRLEHLEAVDRAALADLADLGVAASVQPAFDARWGAPDGMYAARLGAERAARLNPFAEILAAGMPLAFGSDSPVTPFDPWGGVRAAVEHHRPESRLSPDAALAAHTVAGWAMAGRPGRGTLTVGGTADLAAWALPERPAAAPGTRQARDELADLLAELTAPVTDAGQPRPRRSLLTVVAGRVVHRAESDLGGP